MEYKSYPPNSELATLVKCYWTLNIAKEVPKGQQQVLPDGCMDMIFNLGDNIKRILSKHSYQIQPRSFILGQITEPFWVEPTGKVETFAIAFYPGSFSYFTKTPMSSLVNKETTLITLFEKDRIQKIETDIFHAKETAHRITIIEKFLFDLLKENIDIDDLLASTIDKIFQTKGTIGVKKMLQEDANKRRQIERKFSKKVGLSPKQLCRIIRLQATLKLMLTENKTLTKVGYINDYYDQAHFIKDFKDFTGISPKEFYQNESFKLSSLLYG